MAACQYITGSHFQRFFKNICAKNFAILTVPHSRCFSYEFFACSLLLGIRLEALFVQGRFLTLTNSLKRLITSDKFVLKDRANERLDDYFICTRKLSRSLESEIQHSQICIKRRIQRCKHIICKSAHKVFTLKILTCVLGIWRVYVCLLMIIINRSYIENMLKRRTLRRSVSTAKRTASSSCSRSGGLSCREWWCDMVVLLWGHAALSVFTYKSLLIPLLLFLNAKKFGGWGEGGGGEGKYTFGRAFGFLVFKYVCYTHDISVCCFTLHICFNFLSIHAHFFFFWISPFIICSLKISSSCHTLPSSLFIFYFVCVCVCTPIYTPN